MADGSQSPNDQIAAWARTLWSIVKPTVDGFTSRWCTHLRRQVNLGIVDKLPAVCLDTIPFEAGDIGCDAACRRHINALAVLRQLSPIPEDVALCLLPYLSFVGMGTGDLFFLQTWVQNLLMDRTPPDHLPDLLPTEARAYGSGPSFTVSGLHGYQHLLSDQEVQTLDAGPAAAVLQQCVSDSVKDGVLRLFHAVLGTGRFWADARKAPLIPEVGEWVRSLSRRFPTLWFFTDPDSAAWIYACLRPGSVEGDSVRYDRGTFLDLFALSASAAVSALSEAGCDPNRTESLIAQGAFYKSVWLYDWERADVEHRIIRQLDAAIGQLEATELRHTIEELRFLLAQSIKEKLLQSYNDGQVHTCAFGPHNGVWFHLVTFPCGIQKARQCFLQNYTNYLSFLQSSAAPKNGLNPFFGGKLFCQVVVCTESPYEFKIAIALWDLESSRVLQLPISFARD